MFRFEFGSADRRVWSCLLLIAFLLVPLGSPGTVLGQEASGEESYVRKVDSPPPLADSEKGPGWKYNTAYIYAVTKALRDSRMHDAAKVPLFLGSIVVDTVLLPIALIAGLAGE
jgi:hypothetical protein